MPSPAHRDDHQAAVFLAPVVCLYQPIHPHFSEQLPQHRTPYPRPVSGMEHSEAGEAVSLLGGTPSLVGVVHTVSTHECDRQHAAGVWVPTPLCKSGQASWGRLFECPLRRQAGSFCWMGVGWEGVEGSNAGEGTKG